MITQIIVNKCDGNVLELDFDGEIRIFEIEKEDVEINKKIGDLKEIDSIYKELNSDLNISKLLAEDSDLNKLGDLPF